MQNRYLGLKIQFVNYKFEIVHYFLLFYVSSQSREERNPNKTQITSLKASLSYMSLNVQR